MCGWPGEAHEGRGHYLGSVDQPPSVEQAKPVLVTVAEAGLVGVPLGTMVFVLQRKETWGGVTVQAGRGSSHSGAPLARIHPLCWSCGARGELWGSPWWL